MWRMDASSSNDGARRLIDHRGRSPTSSKNEKAFKKNNFFFILYADVFHFLRDLVSFFGAVDLVCVLFYLRMKSFMFFLNSP